MQKHRRNCMLLAVLIVSAAAVVPALFARPAFDPATVARAESRMWQAYYSGNRARLGILLVRLLRNQFGLSFLEARQTAGLLTRAALTFRTARTDYERLVLPDLAGAYARIRKAKGAAFDPEAVARAELAWWIARRTPGENSTEQVGARIAELYVLLYGNEHPAFAAAGHLRARAAGLRDAAGKDADWSEIEHLLLQSYRKLGEAAAGAVPPS